MKLKYYAKWKLLKGAVGVKTFQVRESSGQRLWFRLLPQHLDTWPGTQQGTQ